MQTGHRKSLRALWCLLLVPLVTGCKTTSPSSAVEAVNQQFSIEPVPPVTCPTGSELSQFILTAIEPMPTLASLNLPPPKGTMPPLVAPSNTQNVKFEICVRNDDLTLVRVVARHGTLLDVISVPPGSKVEGLSAAVFAQDYSHLSVKIPFETLQRWTDTQPRPASDLLLVKGAAFGPPGGVVVVTYTVEEEGQPFLSPRVGNRIMVGHLEYGTFPEDPCPGGVPRTGAFVLGTARFEWTGCQFAGTSGGTAPVLKELTVTDSAAALPQGVRGFPVRVKLDDGPNGNYKFKNNHHSVCDSFLLKLPHAKYAATSSILGFGGGGCSGVVEDAPEPGPAVNYRMKYGDGAWVEGATNASCTHFTRACQP